MNNKLFLLCLVTTVIFATQEPKSDKFFKVTVYNYTGQKLYVYPLKENFVGTLYLDTDHKVSLLNNRKASFSRSSLKKIYIYAEDKAFLFKIPITLNKFTAEKIVLSHIDFNFHEERRPVLILHVKSNWGEKRTIRIRASKESTGLRIREKAL